MPCSLPHRWLRHLRLRVRRWIGMTAMKIGVMMHVTNSMVTPAVLAVEAEQRGFESVFVTEHTHIPVRPFIA
jgi:hypothetical protein